KTLTITSTGGTKIYGEIYLFATSFPSDDYVVSGLAGTDSIASVTLTSTGAAAGALVGPYPIVPSGPVFASGSPSNYNIQYVAGWLIVGARDGRVAYIGQTLFVTSGSSSTTAQVTRTASVSDPTPGGGIISAATVTFTDLLTGKVLASGVKVAPVSNTTTQTGTANTIVTLSTGQYGAQEYLIEVSLGGSYRNDQQTTADPGTPPYNATHAVVTVMIPATRNTMQGTGIIDKLPTAAGVLGLGTESNYTAGFSYNNKGTNAQGKMELIIQQTDGTS